MAVILKAISISTLTVCGLIVVLGVLLLPGNLDGLRNPYAVSIGQVQFDAHGESAILQYRRIPLDPSGAPASLLGHVRIRDGECSPQILFPGIQIQCMIASFDGGIAASSEGVLYEFDLKNGSLSQAAVIGKQEHRTIMRMARSADGQRLATLTSNHVYVWDIPSRTQLGSFSANAVTLLMTDDGNRLITCELDGRVVERSLPSGDIVRVLSTNHSMVTALALSPNQQVLVFVTARGHLQGIDLQSDRLLWERQLSGLNSEEAGGLSIASSIAFSPDGRWLLTAADEGSNGWTVALRDASNGQRRANLRGPLGVVRGLSFTPRGQLCAWSADGSIYLWNQTNTKDWTLQRSIVRSGDLRP